MKKLMTATAILTLLLTALVPAAEISGKSEIVSVTVYPDRALITRAANVNITPGAHKLIFNDLPGALDDQSVRGWGKGTASVKLLGLDISRQELPQASDVEIRALEAKIDAAQTELNAISQERFILDNEKSFLESFSVGFVTAYNRNLVSGGSPAARLAGTQDLVGRRLSAIADRRIELDVRERALRRDIQTLQEQLNKISHPGETQKKTLTVEIECLSAGNLTLNFSYIMSNAGWNPLYDIRANSSTGKIEIVSKAQVRQRTGEDWNRVELTLSTASPQVGGTMPEPVPQVLDFQPEYPQEGRRLATGGMAFRKMDARPEAPPPPNQPVTTAAATMVAGETAIEYKIETPRTIASDGKPNMTPIGSDTFDGALSYMAVPMDSPYAYLRAKVKNTSDRSFTAGQANVFLAGRFVGPAALPRWAPGEEIDVPLGIDEGIAISRKLISKKTDTSMGKTTVNYEWRMEITNNLGRRTTLKLYESIPQSRNNDIEVKVTTAEPEPTQIEDEGKARWDIDLAPGAKVTIKLAYRVKYPSAREIENLP